MLNLLTDLLIHDRQGILLVGKCPLGQMYELQNNVDENRLFLVSNKNLSRGWLLHLEDPILHKHLPVEVDELDKQK